MSSPSPKLTHVIEGKPGKPGSLFVDLNIIEIATGTEQILINAVNLDVDSINPVWVMSDDQTLINNFYDLLEDILGGEEALLDVWYGGERHKISHANKERLCAAHALYLAEAKIENAEDKPYRLGFVESEITGGHDIKITKLSNGRGAILHDLPDPESRLGFRRAVAEILGTGWEWLPSRDPPLLVSAPVTKSIVTQIRTAYDEWTLRLLRRPHDPKLNEYLKPQGFSPQNPSL